MGGRESIITKCPRSKLLRLISNHLFKKYSITFQKEFASFILLWGCFINSFIKTDDTAMELSCHCHKNASSFQEHGHKMVRKSVLDWIDEGWMFVWFVLIQSWELPKYWNHTILFIRDFLGPPPCFPALLATWSHPLVYLEPLPNPNL